MQTIVRTFVHASILIVLKNNQMRVIKQEIKERIQDSTKTKTMLAYVLDKHQTSIERYLTQDDILLTTDAALNVISEELAIEKSEILTEA